MMHQTMPPMHAAAAAGSAMVGVGAQYHHVPGGSPSRGGSLGRSNSNPSISYHLSPQPHSNPRSKGGVHGGSSVHLQQHHHHHSGGMSGGSHHPSGGGGGATHTNPSAAAAAHASAAAASMSAANAAMMMAGGAMSHLPGGGNLMSSEIKPPKKPEKPMSSYMRFNKRVHEKIKAENPQMKMWDIAKIIGQMWRELPEHEKQVLNEEYEVEKSRYNEELKAYYNSPAYQTYLQLKNREKQLQEQHNAALAHANDSRSLLNDSKMTITPAIDDEDLDEDGFGIKHLAAARYRRNNRLIMDIFNDFHVSTTDQPSVVTVSRLKALQAQVESLIEHENKYIDQLIELEKKHESRKRAIEESRKQFEEDWDRLSAKKFNWQTATESELDEIKSWFKATYGIDVGQSGMSSSAEKEAAEKDKPKFGGQTPTGETKSGAASSASSKAAASKSPQHTPNESTVSSESDAQTKPSQSQSGDSLKESKEKSSRTSTSSSSCSSAIANSSNSGGVSKTNEDNIASAINVVLQEHAVQTPPQSANTLESAETPSENMERPDVPENQEENMQQAEPAEIEQQPITEQESSEPQPTESSTNEKEASEVTSEITSSAPEAMDSEEKAEKTKDPDFVPPSEDSNMGLDEDSTDVPPTSEDDDDERLNHSSDISSGERDE